MVQAIQVLRFHLLELEKVSVCNIFFPASLNERLERANNQRKEYPTRQQKSIVSGVYGDGDEIFKLLKAAPHKTAQNVGKKYSNPNFFPRNP